MASSSEYYKKIKELEQNAPGAYQSQYGTKIGELLDKITNRKEFSYDFNADPLYHAYKDNYTKLGSEAAMNAVANASAMTGGYGNSYAVTAGAQANQQYLTKLNDVIPSLYSAAQSKYDMDTSNLNSQYSMYSDAENSAYQKYRDALSDYYTQLNYYQNAYDKASAREAAEMAAAQASTGGGSIGGGTPSGGASSGGTPSGSKTSGTMGNYTYEPSGYTGFVGNTNAQYYAMQSAAQAVAQKESNIQKEASGIAKNSNNNVNAVYNYVNSKVSSGAISADKGADILNKALNTR